MIESEKPPEEPWCLIGSLKNKGHIFQALWCAYSFLHIRNTT